MPRRRGRARRPASISSPTQKLRHTYAAINTAGTVGVPPSTLGVVPLRPCRPRRFHIEYLATSPPSGLVDVFPYATFYFEIYSPGGLSIYQSPALIASTTARQFTVNLPRSTDFGEFVGPSPLAFSFTHSTSGAYQLVYTAWEEFDYKDAVPTLT